MPYTAMRNLAAGDLVAEADMDALRTNLDYVHLPNAVYTARGAVTTTSTDYADIAGMSAIHTAYGGITTINFIGDFTTAGNGSATTYLAMLVDSTTVATDAMLLLYNYTHRLGSTITWATAMASGAHTIKMQWKTIANNTAAMVSGQLLVYGG